jgi:O-antigen/teichoic acid export membrane protein
LLIALYLYRRELGQALHPHFEIPFILYLLRVSIPYAANMALGPVYLRIDVLMLSYYQGSAAVGLYEAGTSIFYRFNIVARMFNNAMMPLLAREYEKESSRFRHYVHAAAKYQTAIGMPLTVLCVLLGGQIITLFYGEGFVEAGIVFSLLATIITLRFLDNMWAMMLTAVNMQKHRSIIVAIAAVFNVTLNFYFIPRYGFLGATITTILTEICFGIGLYFALSSRIPRPMPWDVLIRPSLAIAVMGLAIWFLADLPLLILVLLAGAIYLIVLIALGTFSPEEFRFFLHIIQFQKLTMPLQRRFNLARNSKSFPGGK